MQRENGHCQCYIESSMFFFVFSNPPLPGYINRRPCPGAAQGAHYSAPSQRARGEIFKLSLRRSIAGADDRRRDGAADTGQRAPAYAVTRSGRRSRDATASRRAEPTRREKQGPLRVEPRARGRRPPTQPRPPDGGAARTRATQAVGCCPRGVGRRRRRPAADGDLDPLHHWQSTLLKLENIVWN